MCKQLVAKLEERLAPKWRVSGSNHFPPFMPLAVFDDAYSRKNGREKTEKKKTRKTRKNKNIKN